MSLTLGSNGPQVTRWQQTMVARYRSYALAFDGGPLKPDGYYGMDDAAVQREYEYRTHQVMDGVVSDADLAALGLALPVVFTVEGHQSNMFFGPVADTATQLEQEGLCHHEPTGYDNGAIPFDNASGETELARRVGQLVQDNGVPTPAGTPVLFGAFSQGAIVLFDFYNNWLAPGKPLNWRLKDVKGYLVYGNPCRQTDSIASWAQPWIKKSGTHGLDPLRRFGINGFPTKPDTWVDVYREGDIFAENGDDNASLCKAAVYEAVARGDFAGNPYTLAAQIAATFKMPVQQVLAIIKALLSGAVFLGQQPNPHYGPYDIGGGLDWMRQRLKT